QLAGRKVPIHEVAVLTNHDHGLWRIAVAAHPVGVHPADGPWQTVGWAIKVDGAILSFITRQNSELRLLLRGQGVANLGHGFSQLWPANLHIEIAAIDLIRRTPPAGVERSNGECHRGGDQAGDDQGPPGGSSRDQSGANAE